MRAEFLLAFVVVGAVAGLVLAGLASILAGLRGRVVDHHPRCATCGYDLVGHFRRPERCPECAAWLRGSRAVLLGRRRPRAGRLALGGVLLAGACALTIAFSMPRPVAVAAPVAAAGGAGPAPRNALNATMVMPLRRGGDELIRIASAAPALPLETAPARRTVHEHRPAWRRVMAAAWLEPEAFEPDHGRFRHVDPPEAMRRGAALRRGPWREASRTGPASRGPLVDPIPRSAAMASR